MVRFEKRINSPSGWASAYVDQSPGRAEGNPGRHTENCARLTARIATATRKHDSAMNLRAASAGILATVHMLRNSSMHCEHSMILVQGTAFQYRSLQSLHHVCMPDLAPGPQAAQDAQERVDRAM